MQTKKKGKVGTGNEGNDQVTITEQNIIDINNDNQQILTKLGEIQNSLGSINKRIDDIDKNEKEHWFWKNLKSPNFFTVWFPLAITTMLGGFWALFKFIKFLWDFYQSNPPQ